MTDTHRQPSSPNHWSDPMSPAAAATFLGVGESALRERLVASADGAYQSSTKLSGTFAYKGQDGLVLEREFRAERTSASRRTPWRIELGAEHRPRYASSPSGKLPSGSSSSHVAESLSKWGCVSFVALLVLTVAALVVADALGLTYDQRHPDSNKNQLSSVSEKPVSPSSPAWEQLAAIQAGTKAPSESLRSEFKIAFEGLSSSCDVDNDRQLGDLLVAGQHLLESRQVNSSLLELTQAANKSSSKGGIRLRCNEIVASLVAIASGGRR